MSTTAGARSPACAPPKPPATAGPRRCTRPTARACARPGMPRSRPTNRFTCATASCAPTAARPGSSATRSRSAARDGRSEWLDRHHHRRHRQRPAGGRTRTREIRGRSGDAREEPVPGQHEPRDPHAAQRRDRHDDAAAGHADERRPARLRADDPGQQRSPARASSTTSSTTRRPMSASSSSSAGRSICAAWSRSRSTR